MEKKCAHIFVKIHKSPKETVLRCCRCSAELSEAEHEALKAKAKKDDKAE